MSSDTLLRIRQALGRSAPADQSPVAPPLREPLVRLVHTEFGLPELFTAIARQNQMQVERVYPEELLPKLIDFLREQNCRKLVLPDSEFLSKLGVIAGLKEGGFNLRDWPELTADDSHSFDCAITDIYAAMAETGSLVIRPSPKHGRAMSLLPPVHIAIAEPRLFLPDLLDLFEKLTRDGSPDITIINGPSTTMDPQMRPIPGLHGPRLVRAFVLQ